MSGVELFRLSTGHTQDIKLRGDTLMKHPSNTESDSNPQPALVYNE